MHHNVTCLFLTFRFKTNEILTIMKHWKLCLGHVFLVFAFKTNEISIVFLKTNKNSKKSQKTKKTKKSPSQILIWGEGSRHETGGALDMTPGGSRHDTVTPWHRDTVTPWHRDTVTPCHVTPCRSVTVSRCHGVMSRAPPLRSESGSATFWFFLFFGFFWFFGFFFQKKYWYFVGFKSKNQKDASKK